jgi:hypothetical protein
MNTEERKKAFGESGWVSYLSPFTIVVPDDEEPLEVDLEEINNNSYNHGKLCRIVAKMPIKSQELESLICYDGAIAIPMIKQLGKKENAVDYFNDIFCKLLLGGHHCEAVDRRDIVTGQLKNKGMIWPVDFGDSKSSNLHGKLRMQMASNVESIILSKPNYIKVSDFKNAIRIGTEVLSLIPNLTSTFLIRGVTEVKYRNWDLVLSNLWITVEQLIDFIWNNKYINNNDYHPNEPIPGRIKSMKEDNRTWSASVKQEILYQRGLLSEEIIDKLYPARKARNKLVHEGKKVSESIAVGILETVKELIEQSTDKKDIPFLKLDFSSNHESRMDEINRESEHYENWNKE